MTAVSVKDSIALVTGGQRGIGSAFALELLQRGAKRVYVTAREPQETNDPRLVPLPLEVTDDDSVARLAASIPELSIVVNNAGRGGAGIAIRSQIETMKGLIANESVGAV